jgi:hypothetical protein
MQTAMASSERIFRLLDRKEAITDAEKPLNLPALKVKLSSET